MGKNISQCNNRITYQNKQFPDGRTLIRCRNYGGDARMECIPVFPGIQLALIEGHTDRCPFGKTADWDNIELHFCFEGRIQRRCGDQYLYLMPGEAVLIYPGCGTEDISFPLCHYHGVVFLFDRKRMPDNFATLLDGMKVSLTELFRKYCSEEGYCLLREQPLLQRIFGDIKEPPEENKKGYYQIKLLELLLVLDSLDLKKVPQQVPALSKMQQELAREVAAFLTDNLNNMITAEQLAKEFHVSQTCLRSAFKGVYGVPIYSYIRIQKMYRAALQLLHSDRSILEIANSCGYGNASKFASAFREIMGETPLEYRKNHT